MGVVHSVVVEANFSSEGKEAKKGTTPAGLEPALPEGNRFLIYRRNHLAMVSDKITFKIYLMYINHYS